MKASYSRLGIAMLLMMSVASVLLWSDRHSRHGGQDTNAQTHMASVALLMHSSSPLLEEVRQGVLDGLANAGYHQGETLALEIYNPEGDMPTASLMAQKMVSSRFDLGISISTLMLQTLANANQQGRLRHVFGAVTAPQSAGVGIQQLDTLNKPAYLTGIATPQPVAEIFRLARQINPQLKNVGVLWNPSEMNSEVCTHMARDVARELGLNLIEAPVEQTKDVREVALSLISRGVEAFWAGGDLTVNNAIDSLIGVAQTAHIPVFSNITGHARLGGLFDLGANYHDVGMEIGRLGAEVLKGSDPERMPVHNFIPRKIILNLKTAQGLGSAWQFPEDVQAQAAEIIGTDGQVHMSSKALPVPIAAQHVWKLKRVMYVESPPAEEALQGLEDGLRAAGLVAGRDYELSASSAQGDMAVLSALIDSVKHDGSELLITLSTPTLQAAVNKIKNIPVVFTLVSNPFMAGAGQDENHHQDNITGVYTIGPYQQMAALIAEYFPRWRRVGTLFTPSEDNSVYSKDLFTEKMRVQGIEVVALPVNSPGEISDAALALASKNIDAIVQIPDNQSSAGFAAIGQAALRARKPLFSFAEAGVRQGAALAYTLDYYQSGYDAAFKIAAVMHGQSPATIPFNRPSKFQLLVNEANARLQDLILPVALIQKAEKPH